MPYKGHSCIAPNCKSGYASKKNVEKIHFFSVPIGKDTVEKWQKAIPRADFIVKSGQVVCEKHFLPDDILWKREVKDSQGNVMASENYKVPRLKKGALPSIFPNCPKYLSNSKRKRPPPTAREVSFEEIKKEKKRKILNKCDENSNTIDVREEPILTNSESNNTPTEISRESNQINCHLPPASCEEQKLPSHSSVHSDSVPDVTEKSRLDLFDSLFQSEEFFNIHPAWRRCNIQEGQLRAIQFSHCTGRLENGIVKTVMQKKIVLCQDMSIQVSVLNMLVENQKLGFTKDFISSANEIEKLIDTFQKARICQGCATPDSVRNFETSFAFKDYLGSLRHNDCSLILDESANKKTKYCEKCRKAKITLANKTLRLQKRKCLQRIVLKWSPNKEKKSQLLQRKLNATARQKNRAATQLSFIKSEFRNLQQKISSINEESLQKKLKEHKLEKNEETVIFEILNATKCKKSTGRRYSEDWIILSLLFHMKSPASYRMLRDAKILPLPCTNTIRRYLSLMETPCGFSKSLFDLLATALNGKPQIQRHGILLVDEMSTRKGVQLDQKSMTYKGLVDFGDNKERKIDEMADHGLVFIFQTLMGDFTQPIAVFTSNGTTPGKTLAKLIVQAIALLERSGARVHGVVTDGASTNRKFWKEVQVSGQFNNTRHCFPNPFDANRVIYMFADTPHLIKCVRNILLTRKELQIDLNKTVKWEYFEKLYNIDRSNIHGRFCPKLTPNHIKPNNFLKMRVSLAVQIFSKTTANGLLNYKPFYLEMKGCEPTAEFCMRINNLFDALNITKPTNGLTLQSNELKVMRDSLSWLNDWEQKVVQKQISADKFLTPQTSEGLRVTILSAMDLSKILLETYKFDYVLTGKINQDSLERFFGTVRMSAGANDHPTTPTFLQIFKILTAHSLLKPPKSGNCTVFDGNPPQPLITISKLKELHNSPDKTTAMQELREKLNLAIDYEDSDFSDFVDATTHDYALPIVQDCLLFYLTGRITAYIKKENKCTVCLNAFLSTSDIREDNPLFSCNQLPESLSRFTKNDGHFIHPSVRLYKLLASIEHLFNKYCKLSNCFDLILNDLALSDEKINFPCKEHSEDAVDILSYIIKLFLEVRMRQYVNQHNAEIKKLSLLKKKAAKLCVS